MEPDWSLAAYLGLTWIRHLSLADPTACPCQATGQYASQLLWQAGSCNVSFHIWENQQQFKDLHQYAGTCLPCVPILTWDQARQNLLSSYTMYVSNFIVGSFSIFCKMCTFEKKKSENEPTMKL